MWTTISKDCKDLIMKMLVPAEKRLSAQQVLDHPWLQKYAEKKRIAELPPIVTQNLRSFRGAQRVKKAVLTYLATQLSERELDPVKKLFVALDKNGDGKLSREEVKQGLLGKSNEKELCDLVLAMDTDASGFVDYNGISKKLHMHGIEFLAAAIGEDVYLNKDKLLQAFNMFDKVASVKRTHMVGQEREDRGKGARGGDRD
ncbi:MAG: hypothetical protein P4M11_13835 [Candidatus Pacebacteria bacterium]|nr:hypothetical protein [Candidatus Paceibacterota bacterium]